MQIVKRRGETNGKHFTFGDLLDGDWFEDEEGTLYVKIELVGGDLEEFNAVELANGALYWFANNEEIRYYAGAVTIDGDSFEEYTFKN